MYEKLFAVVYPIGDDGEDMGAQVGSYHTIAQLVRNYFPADALARFAEFAQMSNPGGSAYLGDDAGHEGVWVLNCSPMTGAQDVNPVTWQVPMNEKCDGVQWHTGRKDENAALEWVCTCGWHGWGTRHMLDHVQARTFFHDTGYTLGEIQAKAIAAGGDYSPPEQYGEGDDEPGIYTIARPGDGREYWFKEKHPGAWFVDHTWTSFILGRHHEA